MGTTRNVQAIKITDEEDEQSNNVPTRSPVVAVPRPTRIRVCTNAEQDIIAVTTEVRYRYQVKVAPGETSDLNWSHDIPAWVNGATVDILAGYFCSGSDEVAIEDPFNRQLGDLAQCVLSISSGFRDVLLNDACTTAESLCALYSGTVRVTYTDLCTRSEVMDAVLDLVQGGTAESDLLEISNQIAMQDDIQLTSVTFSEHPVVDFPQETQVPEDMPTTSTKDPDASVVQDDVAPVSIKEGGLTGTGKAMVSLVGLVLIFMLALLFVWRRRERKRQKRPDDDSHSFKTEWSSPSQERNGTRSNNFHHDNLQNTTKLDVHHCASGCCPVCKSRAASVELLSVHHHTPLKPIDELLRRGKNNNDDSSEEAESKTSSGETARVLFSDAESAVCSTSYGPTEPPTSYSLEDDMADTNPMYVMKDQAEVVDESNAGVDIGSVLTEGGIIEGGESIETPLPSFHEILDDVTFVRREEPESDMGSQQVDRPKLNPPGYRLPTSITL